MIVAVTGTRFGMTEQQTQVVRRILWSLKPKEFQHGDCVGVDDQVATLVRETLPDCWIVARPGPRSEWSASNACFNLRHPEEGHFARNRKLVAACDLLLVCPRDMELGQQGGTAYTCNYAKHKNKAYIIIWPDGSVLMEDRGMKLDWLAVTS